MRLIDADVIRYTDLNADMPKSKVRVWVTFKEWIDAMPTVEERKTGEWQITDAYPHNVYCSVCHKRFAQTHWKVWEDGSLPRKFCPNCGSYNGGNDEK